MYINYWIIRQQTKMSKRCQHKADEKNIQDSRAQQKTDFQQS